MRLFLTGVFIIIIQINCVAQNYSSFTETIRKLYSGVETDKLWQSLVESNSIPLTLEDSVAFLYRGNASSVAWMGDFNGWGYDKKYKNKGIKIPNTDIWILKAYFPKNARLDYKIILNETDWIIDPSNKYYQWSGVGGGSPNSELRMPYWKPDPITIQRDGSTHGKLEKDILLNSTSLGYQLTYAIYTPSGYTPSQTYPVIFVTDGYEYLHEKLGNMQTVLDNLIDQKMIQPIIAVFIDHREPVNRSNNRRMQELAMNTKYLDFFSMEFIPLIESKYPVTHDPNNRAILGSSLGGLTAAYFAFTKPGIFGMTGIQSPSFWFKPEIYTVCDNAEHPPVKIYMTTGVYYDAEVGARKMKEILEKDFCTYQYSETNQGHSWGNFRDTIDDILVYFFPPK